MDSHDIQEFIQVLDDTQTKARMLRCIADDLEAVLYQAQVMIAKMQNELDGRE